MAKVLSVINLKGGVGKTTLTVAAAEALAAVGARVLVMDLDPQTNATVMLIGDEKWRELDGRERTLSHLFQRALDGKLARLEDILLREAAFVKGAGGISRPIGLVPSSIGLVLIQDRLVNIPSGDFQTRAPAAVIRDAAERVLSDYEYVLVDCPPNLGIVTLNGLLISDAFVIPAIPDILSTYGIPQILERTERFSGETGRRLEPLGVVASMFRTQVGEHHRGLDSLKNGRPPLIEPVIAQRGAYAEAAEHKPHPRSLKERWGGGSKLEEPWINLAGEIRRKLEELQ